ncbi:uncharacterized protein LOC131933109 [Physella acuta]|uniref:uncharacterized protein LOC131933109 n=1 Tax=Physella acuta TaxID=109671 RepID=UPI0027DAD3B8|nr:uncharacterized protein LOC131933109 [Physella acuta]
MCGLFFGSLVFTLFAAEALAKSNSDSTFINDVTSELFGKCYKPCFTERESLYGAKDDKERCSKAVDYRTCISNFAECKSGDVLKEFENFYDEVNRLCETGTPDTPKETTTTPSTPSTTTTPTTTTPATTTTPTTTTSTATTTTKTPNNQAIGGRKRRATDIKTAVDNLLKANLTCVNEMCLANKTAMLSPDQKTIDCTLLGVYGKCLSETCPGLEPSVTKYNEKCGADNIQLFSYVLLTAGVMFKLLV